VARAAAKYLTPICLELGGKSPVLIDRNCDLKVVARRVVWGRMMNNGQTCVCADYVLVHQDVIQDFQNEAILALEEYYGIDPKESPHLARIVNERHVDRVVGLLKQTKGRMLTGGLGSVDREAKFVPPTLVTDVPREDILLQHEIFGPILPIVKVISDSLSFSPVTSHFILSHIPSC